MTSASLTQTLFSEDTSSAVLRVPLRLKLKPKAPAAGFVDGAWWPQSRDLAAELPALLAVLSIRLGRIERVGYHLTDWVSPPRRINLAAGVVRLAGYRSQRANTIDVLAEHQHLTLLVVPPETSAQPAHRALTVAGQRGNLHTPADLLGGANAQTSHARTPRSAPR
jgi:hypothetical protein